MTAKTQVKELLTELFKEEALIIGGLIATHKVEDGFIWDLMSGIDAVRRRFFPRLEEVESKDEDSEPEVKLKPHPAIEEFLLRLRQERQ